MTKSNKTNTRGETLDQKMSDAAPVQGAGPSDLLNVPSGKPQGSKKGRKEKIRHAKAGDPTQPTLGPDVHVSSSKQGDKRRRKGDSSSLTIVKVARDDEMDVDEQPLNQDD